MTVYFPSGVDAQGNESIIWVATLATPSTPKLTELNAAGSVNLSCSLRGFAPGAEQGSSEDIRLCSTETFENPGRVKYNIDDITYVYDPQAVVPTVTNKHYETLVEGAIGYLIDRRGLSALNTIWVIGQKVDVYPVTLGPQRRVALDPSAEGGKFEIVQKPYIRAKVWKDVALIA